MTCSYKAATGGRGTAATGGGFIEHRMRILLATSNPHKLGEIRAIFDACADAALEQGEGAALKRIDLIGFDAIKLTIAKPAEDQPTFEANATLKARYYASATGMLCLADDSGLEVDALGGAPGVRSARYAKLTGSRGDVDAANNRLLMQNLRGVPVEKRTARFVCAMALCRPSDTGEPLALVRGAVEGRILTDGEAGDEARGRGDNGFGYDPLFYVPELGKTAGELAPDHKNRISHRGNAARRMWQAIGRITHTDIGSSGAVDDR